MPKKMSGMNSKAAAAKAKKEEVRTMEKAKKEQEAEDAKWRDEGSKTEKRKKERKQEQERKKNEQIEKKQERQKLLDEEYDSLKSKPIHSKPPKMTRDEIQQKLQAINTTKKKEVVAALPIEENMNRLDLTENTAKNVDEAIYVLSTNPSLVKDKHPEKRMKAAYDEFETSRLKQLKDDNPNLRLSQLKQILRKEWLKHPSNPFNQHD